ncbi:MAG: hypothetical protein AVDCRST_MAG01-01-4699, partial [uncultured Rubrobacteraceae bacterium]
CPAHRSGETDREPPGSRPRFCTPSSCSTSCLRRSAPSGHHTKH